MTLGAPVKLPGDQLPGGIGPKSNFLWPTVQIQLSTKSQARAACVPRQLLWHVAYKPWFGPLHTRLSSGLPCGQVDSQRRNVFPLGYSPNIQPAVPRPLHVSTWEQRVSRGLLFLNHLAGNFPSIPFPFTWWCAVCLHPLLHRWCPTWGKLIPALALWKLQKGWSHTKDRWHPS